MISCFYTLIISCCLFMKLFNYYIYLLLKYLYNSSYEKNNYYSVKQYNRYISIFSNNICILAVINIKQEKKSTKYLLHDYHYFL